MITFFKAAGIWFFYLDECISDKIIAVVERNKIWIQNIAQKLSSAFATNRIEEQDRSQWLDLKNFLETSAPCA